MSEYDKPFEERKETPSIYVAGPYTIGTPDHNVRQAIDAGNELRERGWMPFIPHLNFLWGLRHDRETQFWMEWCLDWLAQCNALYRLDGESKGGDIEVEKAKEWGLDVYFELDNVPEV